ncbi:class F sortase [Spelaeicoccus albus]|uniref:Sortase (Surface protein transpeptidase) n=1 Tax=Spelaeicoccus albus TaxID=1280376 RepID=A0A7Z0D174_9MICO|nr:class F sortase [Spelaeicoccus albus]NYI66488.1 sortase (surface protein transpeptidase) [Spelaeicoccus albus]
MTRIGFGRRGRMVLSAVAVVLALVGGWAILSGFAKNDPPPQPSAAEATPTKAPHPSSGSKSRSGSHQPQPTGAGTSSPKPPPHLKRSKPVHLTVPAIGVDTSLITLGLDENGEMEVPDVRKAKDSKAGWYKYSPTPGQLGPSVIIGHVDSEYKGPAVFYKLGDIKRGDTATVTRADGTKAKFVVTKVVEVKKATFPTSKIYGNTDDAELRLITCGGEFNSATGHHLDNIVVYGKFTP